MDLGRESLSCLRFMNFWLDGFCYTAFESNIFIHGSADRIPALNNMRLDVPSMVPFEGLDTVLCRVKAWVSICYKHEAAANQRSYLFK